MKAKRTAFVLYTALQCLYWMAGCAVVSFAAVYLGGAGFNLSETGAICALGSVVSLFFTNIMASRVDNHKMTIISAFYVHYVLLILCISLSKYACFSKVLAATAYAVCISTSQSLSAFYNKLYSDIINVGVKVNYGISRGMGSLAFSVSSVICGMLISQYTFQIVIFIVLVLTAVQFLVLNSLKRNLQKAGDFKPLLAEQTRNIHGFLKENRAFFILICGLAVVISINRIFATFINVLVEEQGGDSTIQGFLLAYMSVLEIPIIITFSALRKRFSIKQLLIIGILCYPVKALLISLSTNLLGLFLAVSCHGVALGLTTPAMVEYVTANMATQDSAKGHALLASVPTFMGGIAVFASGVMFDKIGISISMLVFTLISMMGALMCMLSIHKSA